MSKTKNSPNTINNNVAVNDMIFVEAINAFNDNYIWAIRSHNSDAIALVDPGDADVCIRYIEQHQLVLGNILITHHHNDHVGGIKSLLDYAQPSSVTVYGPTNDNIPYIDKKLSQGDSVLLTDLKAQFNVLDLPGHTKGHIAYLGPCSTQQPMLFCGDTLFSGGCGRLFEGTPTQMQHSLTKLVALADNTLVYCAHEYTQANLAFALTVEPLNEELQVYAAEVKALRLQKKRTIPSSIGLEKKINPFLRCEQMSIIAAAQRYQNHSSTATVINKNITLQSDITEVFTTIRQWKDRF